MWNLKLTLSVALLLHTFVTVDFRRRCHKHIVSNFLGGLKRRHHRLAVNVVVGDVSEKRSGSQRKALFTPQLIGSQLSWVGDVTRALNNDDDEEEEGRSISQYLWNSHDTLTDSFDTSRRWESKSAWNVLTFGMTRRRETLFEGRPWDWAVHDEKAF